MKKIFFAMMAAVVLTSCTSDNADNTIGGETKPVYQYLYYADARDNMSEAQRAQYAVYCWRLERKDKLQEPKNWRTCQGDFSPNEESELFPDPDYTPSTQGLRQLRATAPPSRSPAHKPRRRHARSADWVMPASPCSTAPSPATAS